MTVQVDSQPVTDQIMCYIDMCCINNSISCLEKKTTLGTHYQTCYVTLFVCLLRLKISKPRTNRRAPELCSLSRACFQIWEKLVLFSSETNDILHTQKLDNVSRISLSRI